MRHQPTYAPTGELTFENVRATIQAANAAGHHWNDAYYDKRGRVMVGDRALQHVLIKRGVDWAAHDDADREKMLAQARDALSLSDPGRPPVTVLSDRERETRPLRPVGRSHAIPDPPATAADWPRLRLQQAEIGQVQEALATNAAVPLAVDDLLAVLRTSQVPPQSKKKSKEWYVYDQRQLQSVIRHALGQHGWGHGRHLADAEKRNGVRITALEADMTKDGVHVLLDFGVRTSYAHNLMTRGVIATARLGVRLTVLVVPTQRFADQIDANLVNYERITIELDRLRSSGVTALPVPLLLIGVAPDLPEG